MITLRKLASLPHETRIRKIVRLLDGFVEYRFLPPMSYLDGLLRLIGETVQGVTGPLALPSPEVTETEAHLRIVDNLRYELRSLLGVPVGDWDLLPPAGFGGDATSAKADAKPNPHAIGKPLAGGGISVYMESIRSPFNAGSIIRTAVALGVKRIGMSVDCPPADHPRLLRSARGAERGVEILRLPVSALGGEWHPLLALETGGTSLREFVFPESGTLLVGSEELGLSKEALDAAGDRLTIRMSGVKGSLNVGVACGIALHAWYEEAGVD